MFKTRGWGNQRPFEQFLKKNRWFGRGELHWGWVLFLGGDDLPLQLIAIRWQVQSVKGDKTNLKVGCSDKVKFLQKTSESECKLRLTGCDRVWQGVTRSYEEWQGVTRFNKEWQGEILAKKSSNCRKNSACKIKEDARPPVRKEAKINLNLLAK